MPVVAAQGNKRQVAAEERRQMILDAALDIFAEQGFAAARLDDVAARAGVAKGTLYLVARDKDDLFQQVVRSATAPVLDALAASATDATPAPQRLAEMMQIFQREVLGSRKRLLARVMLKEAGRFPALAEFHHREVVTRVLALCSTLLTRAQSEGRLRSPAYARFPHLVMAPMLMALVWDSMFSGIAELDVEGLLRAHFEALFGPDPKEEENDG